MIPFASCLCLTMNRRIFLRQAVRQFWRSDYPETRRELVIIDGSDAPNRDFANVRYGDIRYYHMPKAGLGTGYWHNVGVSKCEGDVVVQWDDDDWNHPRRISKQVEALARAEMTFTNRFYWYSLALRRAAHSMTWDVAEPAGMGASFAYKRETWSKTMFRDDAGPEDGVFLSDLVKQGANVHDAKDSRLQVYVRHGSNGSVFTVRDFTDEATRGARELIGSEEELDFYDGIAELLDAPAHAKPGGPLAWGGRGLGVKNW